MRDKFYLILVHIVLILVVIFTTLSLNFHEIFATTITKGLTLDPAMVDMLSEGAYQDSVSFGINMDPDLLVYGIDSIIQDVNNKLYTKYGWDLEDIAWDVEDQMEEPYKKAAAGLITGSQVLGTGYQMFFSSVADKLTGGRDLIVGKVNSVTGKIDEVYDNALTYISDSYVDKLTSVRSELIEDQVLYNFSQANHFLYGKSFHFIYQNISWTMNFDEDVCLFSIPYGQIYILTDYLPPHFYSGSGVMVVNGSPTELVGFNATDVYDSAQVFTIGNKSYYPTALTVQYSTGSSGTVASDILYGDYATVKDFYLGNNGLFASAYSLSNENLLKTVLDSLKGHWVTTDDLEAINEKLDALPIGGVVVDGQTLPVIDTTELALQDLIAYIEDVLDRAALVDEGLANYTGGEGNEPDPDPDPEIPNEIPSWLWPSFIPDLLPEDMFSMFRPVFDIVGSQYSMYGIWIIVPSIIIFILVVYMIVSLF